MGREQPTVIMRPNQNRRDERARRARETKNRIIPELLRSCPRAKHGIARAELIVDPPAVDETSRDDNEAFPRTDLRIHVRAMDTLTAASRISEKVFAAKRTAAAPKSRSTRPNVAVLNMASALRPGGGFLEGANSQEEFLCARTTVYPSLWESFYRLPEVSGIYTPDVLVFRDHLPDAQDLPKSERYFVDVITSSMLRFSDARTEDCSCGVSYCDRHRDIVIRKMKAVMRIAESKGVEKLVLGAWGCGAYGNPVKEIAKLWRKVICGAQRQRRPNTERWSGIKEIVFAIPDRTMLREFEVTFSDVLSSDFNMETDSRVDSGVDLAKEEAEQARTSEIMTRIAEIEYQLEQVCNGRLKLTLRDTLQALQRELLMGQTSRASKDEDQSPEAEEGDDGLTLPDFHASSDLDDSTSFYALADEPSDTDSDPNRSEIYEFNPRAPGGGFDSQTSHDEESQDDLESDSLYPALSHSPQFDPETGWYSGSMEGLTALISGAGGLRSCSRTSPREPEVWRPQSSGLAGLLDAEVLHDYLRRFEGTDDVG